MLEYKSPTTMEMCDVKTYLIEDADPNGPFGAKEVGRSVAASASRGSECGLRRGGSTHRRSTNHAGESVEGVARKAKGGDGRYGPGSVPEVEWPTPMRVLTPAEGGDGRENAAGGAYTRHGEGWGPKLIAKTYDAFTQI